MSEMIRFSIFLFGFFSLMTIFKMALNLPQCLCQLCYSICALQSPTMFLPWCINSIMSEVAFWFITAELLIFTIFQAIFYCLLQLLLPLFWWLCLCYEAYLSSSSHYSPLTSASPVLSFCRTHCIYSSYQLNGSFKFLDPCFQCSSSQVLLSKAGSLHHSWCPSLSSPFAHVLSYVPWGE